VKLNLSLMENNINQEDVNQLIDFLKTETVFTQNKNVRAFEEEWSHWLGVKYSVFVSSGSSANLLSIGALKNLHGGGEVIVPTLTWVSDIAAVLHYGFKPVFVDIDPRHLGMSTDAILAKITPQTKAVFLTYVLGFNALNSRLLQELKRRNIPLIEDVCESHGATFDGKKLGSFGTMSNFSFYYAHHMSTIEGGMVCTNDEKIYEHVRMLRSHGMVRELSSETMRKDYQNKYPDLNPQFIFSYPAYNVRSTELNAVIGRTQLKRLDANNKLRYQNFKLFLDNLDSEKFRTDFDLVGSVNYAFVLILRKPDEAFAKRLMLAMDSAGVEYRRGTSGGGNQLRQPYLQDAIGSRDAKFLAQFPEVDHVHFYGWYMGNFPDLQRDKILGLCELLNNVK
jgi:CDP-6-deoxy-D-xylo-4-hexulose-3-dehydrase